MAADETPTTTVGQYRCHRPLEGVGEVCQRITATRGLTPVVSIAHPATVYPRCREYAGEGLLQPAYSI